MFTYHNNEVYFTSISSPLTEAYNFMGGSYTIEEMKVTDGQDPKNKVTVGQKRTFGQDGKMSFELGRKGSETAAT